MAARDLRSGRGCLDAEHDHHPSRRSLLGRNDRAGRSAGILVLEVEEPGQTRRLNSPPIVECKSSKATKTPVTADTDGPKYPDMFAPARPMCRARAKSGCNAFCRDQRHTSREAAEYDSPARECRGTAHIDASPVDGTAGAQISEHSHPPRFQHEESPRPHPGRTAHSVMELSRGYRAESQNPCSRRRWNRQSRSRSDRIAHGHARCQGRPGSQGEPVPLDGGTRHRFRMAGGLWCVQCKRLTSPSGTRLH